MFIFVSLYIAYDIAVIQFRGVEADINFNIEDYEEDMKQMSNLTKVEFVHVLRRQSTGFARLSSKYKVLNMYTFCSSSSSRYTNYSYVPKKMISQIVYGFTKALNKPVYEVEATSISGKE
ncbi:unnamed protein product [Lupinus luteus]|uniref:Uncharacterized protein n=1 Tax=Lupinus luteus TaxID=3873 RepID=A0AAV1XXN1_LUPLU